MRPRHRHHGQLGWALLLSLLVNHALVLPVAYYLLHEQADPQVEVVEVELDVKEKEEIQDENEILKMEVRRLLARRMSRPKEPEPKPEEKQPEEKPPEDKPVVKKPEEAQPEPLDVRMLRLKMVEVPNPESEEAPKDARFLSDKDRRVERETRALDTNLEKEHPKPRPTSRPSPEVLPEPGAPRQRVAETREQEARPAKAQQPVEPSPLLAMRSPRPMSTAEARRPAEAAPDGEIPAPQPRAPKMDLRLDHRSHDRIFGEQAVAERERARLSPSTPRRGRHEQQWQQVQAALENFIPEVQPGNQTALNTRAHPFALYIARMHRTIHKLWGWGFLADLDMKSDGNAMNNMSLWTAVELVIAPDGSVAKATLVHPSGVLPFDVAALSVVFAAAPYPQTPAKIRSADGNVYMHWRFHRDHRQCGTFGVDPFILTKPPKGPIDREIEEISNKAGTEEGEPRRLRSLNRPAPRGDGKATVQGDSDTPREERDADASASGRSASHGGDLRPVDAKDRAAVRVAGQFARALAAGDVAGMLTSCALPFLVRGRSAATDQVALRRMFQNLVDESRGKSVGAPHLMTLMQARKELGYLPPGADDGQPMLVGTVAVGKGTLTLLLKQGNGGSYRIIGVNP